MSKVVGFEILCFFAKDHLVRAMYSSSAVAMCFRDLTIAA
jgi:hypothetical protein